MDKVFVVKNQQGLYLSKQQEWVNGADSQILFRTAHRDEAINTVFEVSSRDIYLRAEVVACDPDTKNNPVVAVADQPDLPMAESGAADAEPVSDDTPVDSDTVDSDAVDSDLVDSGTADCD